MFSIKQSFADCSTCPLLDCNSCIMETNCEKDLSLVDLVIVAENPGKDEIVKKVPLIGTAGQTFRKLFYKYNLNKLNYLMTNTVLCQTLNQDGTTGNPTDDVINRCKKNCFNIIEVCKPKLILLMGSSPMKAFGISKDGITKFRGQMFKWKNYDVLLTVHPQYVNYNRNTYSEKFEEDIAKVNEILGVSGKSFKAVEKEKVIKTGINRYKIPDKFYNKDYRLIDIQYLGKTDEILYVFRDKNNKKVFHKMNDDYYYYKPKDDIEGRKVIPFENLNCYKTKYKLKSGLDPENTYDGDIRLTVKHAQDYYYYNIEDCPDTNMNIMFIDIEVYNGKYLGFPHPSIARWPICMITAKYHDKPTVFVLDNGTEKVKDIEGTNVLTYKTEKDLMKGFIEYFVNCDPDFCSGWNFIQFDMDYIYNRCKKIEVNYNKLSKVGEVYVDGSKYLCNIPGVVPLDMEFLYKSFAREKREMYKLGFIAKVEKLRTTKMELPGVGAAAISRAYEKNINMLTEYNIRDVEVLVELDQKLKHITLLNEIRKICCSSFDGSSSPMSRLDSLVVNFLKEKGLASKNTNPHKSEVEFEGAFVKDPLRGVHDWIVDFDFTSLYPSLIQTYNIGLNSFDFKLEDYRMGYDFVYNRDNLPDKIVIIEDPTYHHKQVTINKEDLIKRVSDNNLVWTITGCFFKNHDNALSYYAEVLQDLLSSRKVYKKKMFEAGEKGDDFEEAMFDNKQQVYKILANALYGILGNKSFRFFNIDLARSITLSGQEAIKHSILNGNAYVEKIKENREYREPNMITKKEMYEDLSRRTEHVITGDTDSLFITYENLDLSSDPLEEIFKMNNEIQIFLNNFIKNITINYHNVPSERNKLELKNELVIKRGLYLQKKRYANYILFKEGHRKEEIKAMGLETKRSDFPNYTKKKLDLLLELILKSDKLSISKLQDLAERTELDIFKKIKDGSKEIARPVNWVKKISEYKTVPQGVRAMDTWNKLMYSTFDVGTKGYMFKIRGIDDTIAPSEFLDKYENMFLRNGIQLKEIAVPDEEPRLPKWIIPNEREMLKFCWQDRYKLLMEPLLEVDTIDEVMIV